MKTYLDSLLLSMKHCFALIHSLKNLNVNKSYDQAIKINSNFIRYIIIRFCLKFYDEAISNCF